MRKKKKNRIVAHDRAAVKSGAHHHVSVCDIDATWHFHISRAEEEAERGLPEVSQEHENYPLRQALRQLLRVLSCHRLCMFDVYSIRSWAQR